MNAVQMDGGANIAGNLLVYTHVDNFGLNSLLVHSLVVNHDFSAGCEYQLPRS